MADGDGPGDASVPADPDDVLSVVLEAVAATGTDSITVLRPVVGPDGRVDDFHVVAESGLTAELASAPSVGRTLREVMPADLAETLVALNREVVETGRVSRHDFHLGDGVGGLAPLPGADLARGPVRLGEVLRVPVRGLVVVLWRDVTEARAAQRDLRASEERFRRLVEHASDAIIVAAADRTVTYASPAVGAFLGLDPRELVGAVFERFATAEEAALSRELFERVAAARVGGSEHAEIGVLRGDGERRWLAVVATNWLDDPVVGGVVFNIRDVTGQHEAELQLQQQALEDPLTGLPNRRAFVHALHRAADRSSRTGQPFGVLVLDVDNFKVLNDSLGHPVGDQLLSHLARRMAAALRPSDTIARLGGDEFVVLAEDLRDPTDARAVARRIVESASGRYDVGRVASRVTLSIGLTTSEAGHGGSGEDSVPAQERHRQADALLADADAALYQAKRRGRNRIEVFDPALRERMLHRLVMEDELHRAITDEQLRLHWQPIVRATDQRTVAVEALLRWEHPARGLLAAADFLPVAGEVGLVSSLCHWSVVAALEQAGQWAHRSDAPDVFLNIAAAQLSRATLADELAFIAERYRVDPARVHLELSEDALQTDVPRLRDQLEQMRAHGFRIALDDFGAGNTALTWLRQLPIDLLKLDHSLAATLDEAPTRAVVSSIVHLASELGIRTVAEGVETPDQLRFFTDAGCDYTQGYLHARPGPPETVMAPGSGTAVPPEADRPA